MFKIESIIPGIEILPPDLTDSKRGFDFPSKLRPEYCTNLFTASLISPSSESGNSLCSIKWLQTSVVIVKPGGTEIPRLLISARFAPFPPRRLIIEASPSVCSFENSKISLFFMMY